MSDSVTVYTSWSALLRSEPAVRFTVTPDGIHRQASPIVPDLGASIAEAGVAFWTNRRGAVQWSVLPHQPQFMMAVFAYYRRTTNMIVDRADLIPALIAAERATAHMSSPTQQRATPAFKKALTIATKHPHCARSVLAQCFQHDEDGVWTYVNMARDLIDTPVSQRYAGVARIVRAEFVAALLRSEDDFLEGSIDADYQG